MVRQPMRCVAALLFCVVLAVTTACSTPRSEPPRADATDGAHQSVERARPNVLDVPRVERLGRAGWVEVVAAVLGSDDEAPAAARNRAVARARQAAVEYVAGVNVKSSLLSFDQIREGGEGSLVQVLSSSRADALIIDERLTSTSVKPLAGGGYRVDVTLQARVLDHGSDGSDRFRTEAKLNRSAFRDGEDVVLSVRATEPARIYVLAVSDSGAAMVIPSRHVPNTTVDADTWLHFPDARLQARGVRLRAQLPDGRTHAEEALIVIALRGDRRLGRSFPASGVDVATAARGAVATTLNELLAPLLGIPSTDWTFDQLVYGIQPR